LFETLERAPVALPAQTPFRDGGCSEKTEAMEVAQGKLAMGFVTDITIRDRRFAAMQLCNTVFGSGMTSKLFMQVREKMSLCYDISSGYHGAKGLLTVSAGIDVKDVALVRREVMAQLDACARGDITTRELTAAKQALLSSLRGIHDSPGSIENYYASAALSGLNLTPEEYYRAIEQATLEEVAAAAATVKLHTVYFLKGVH